MAGRGIFEIAIELQEVRPTVLRRAQVPADTTLAGLHDVVQVATGWTDSHLHEFDVDGVCYGSPDSDGDRDDVVDDATVTLSCLLEQGSRLDYDYDFGDGWRHRLTVEKVLAAEPGVSYPRCVSGQLACPPEDVGGPWGYDEFVVAMTDLDHPEHPRFREWVGGPFDPAAAFDLDAVNQAPTGGGFRGQNGGGSVAGSWGAAGVGFGGSGGAGGSGP